jgi:uncharacterized protein YdaU (DUF1376 family)
MPKNTKKISGKPAGVYLNLIDTELAAEYEDKTDQYKASILGCKSTAQRKAVMKMYLEDCIDILVEARINEEWELYSKVNKKISSLEKRTFSGGRRKY